MEKTFEWYMVQTFFNASDQEMSALSEEDLFELCYMLDHGISGAPES
jgi:hypothetical protein